MMRVNSLFHSIRFDSSIMLVGRHKMYIVHCTLYTVDGELSVEFNGRVVG